MAKMNLLIQERIIINSNGQDIDSFCDMIKFVSEQTYDAPIDIYIDKLNELELIYEIYDYIEITTSNLLY
jgi:hypothetical protein